MKQLILIFIGMFAISMSSLNAQDGEFERKGRILVETGVGLTNSIIGGSTGVSLLVQEGETITNFSFEGGYFTTENFAVKGQVGFLAVSGFTLVNLSAGGKYYIMGKIPVELNLGLVTGEGLSEFVGGFGIGYGIRLADNINLEPSIKGLIVSESFAIRIGATFAMFL